MATLAGFSCTFRLLSESAQRGYAVFSSQETIPFIGCGHTCTFVHGNGIGRVNEKLNGDSYKIRHKGLIVIFCQYKVARIMRAAYLYFIF